MLGIWKFGYDALHVVTFVLVVPIVITLFEKSPAIKMLLPDPKKNLLLKFVGIDTTLLSDAIYGGGAIDGPMSMLLFPDLGDTEPLPMIMLLDP